MTVPIPPHRAETRAWKQAQRGGNRDDRMLSSVTTSIPPVIAQLSLTVDPGDVAAMERAVLAARAAQSSPGAHSRALGAFLTRTESVASSKIERISADSVAFARALAGSRGNASATSMVAATRALGDLVERSADTARFDLGLVTDAHRALMRDDEHEAAYAGRMRDVQNWIGGSDYSPRNALYVPPPPERVGELMDDLLAYVRRRDVPILVQAAVAHAQFESIHPFTDGNGRIGRALINAILRRRGVTTSGVVPIASGLLAVRDRYFATLSAYREGDAGPILSLLTEATTAAAEAMTVSLARLDELPAEWRDLVSPRRGSTIEALLPILFDHPVLTAGEAERQLPDSSRRSVYEALAALEQADVVAEVTGRVRDKVWVATAVMAELDDLSARIDAAMRS